MILFLSAVAIENAFSCAEGNSYEPDPYFIENNLINSVHYDSVFFENVRLSQFKDARIEEQDKDYDNVTEEWEIYFKKNKIDFFSQNELYENPEELTGTPKPVVDYFKVLYNMNNIPGAWAVSAPATSAKAEIPGADNDERYGKDEFLERRWAYLNIKKAYREKKYDDVVKLYENTFGNSTQSDVPRYRSMGYYALALAMLEKKTDALNVYALYYDAYIPNRFFIKKTVLMRKYFNQNDYEDFYKSDYPNHRKATLAYIVEDADRLIKYEPDSPRTVAFMLREAMKNERVWLVAQWRFLFETEKPAVKSFRKYYNDELKSKNASQDIAVFINRVRKLKCKGREINIKNMLLGYGYFMLGKYSDAEKYYSDAYQGISANDPIYKQLKLFEVLVDFAGDKDHFDPKLQRKAADNMTFTLKCLCINRFIHLGDYIRAAGLMYNVGSDSGTNFSMNNASSFFVDVLASEKQLEKIKLLADGKAEMPFDLYIWKNFPIKVSDIDNVIAWKRLREKDFDGAYKMLRNSEGGETIDDVTQYITPGEWTKDTNTESEKDFIRILSLLAAPDKAPEKEAKNLYTLASIFVSTRFIMFDGMNWDRHGPDTFEWILGTECDNLVHEKELDFTGGKYDRFVIAFDYLQQAMDLTKEREFKAKCSIASYDILEKSVYSIEKKHLPKRFIDKAINFAKRMFSAGDNESDDLEQYVKKYSDTKFYKEYLSNCAPLRDELEGSKN
jgi:hypothetical protein